MILKENIIGTLILLFADFLWLKFYMANQYNKQVRTIQGGELKINPKFAVMTYVLMVLGLNLFVLPNIRKGYELEDSFKYGFTFGIILYGVYAGTSASIFSGWSGKLVLEDIVWGGFVYFISSYLAIILS